MYKKAEVTVGISIGTRYMGIAVIHGHTLTVWEMKRFTGAWSEAKRKNIMGVMETIISRKSPSHIAVKVPHASRTSPALKQLIGDLHEMSGQWNITTYTIDDLRGHMLFPAAWNHNNRTQLLTEIFPELSPLTHPYYEKLFEAAGVALIHSKQTRTP